MAHRHLVKAPVFQDHAELNLRLDHPPRRPLPNGLIAHCMSIADALRGRYVVYTIDAGPDHECGEAQAFFAVYESFDSLAAALPHGIREEIRTRTGRVEVEELDI
jgi:hypothetical protein